LPHICKRLLRGFHNRRILTNEVRAVCREGDLSDKHSVIDVRHDKTFLEVKRAGRPLREKI
jgi:hypothetical protein